MDHGGSPWIAADHVKRDEMTRDELEFSISQYLDGTLAAADAAALEERLAGDADARVVFGEYQSLDAALRATPAPDVDLAAFHTRVTDALVRQPDPAVSYKLPWVGTVRRLALAACVVIAAGVGIRLLQTSRDADVTAISTRPTTPASVEPKQIIVLDGVRRAAPTTGPSEIVVAIGPSSIPQDRPALARYQEDLISRRSQVIIARSGTVAQDGALLP